MKVLHRLIPPFLRQLDLRLQQDHPRLWATRIHYHLWSLLLVNAVVLALGLVLEVTPRTAPDPEELFAYMMFPAVVYFAFWVYKVVLFTVERRFGIRHLYAEVGELMVHFGSIALILTIPYNLAFTVAWRIGHVTDDATFVQEVNTLNTQAPWFYGTDVLYTEEGFNPAYSYVEEATRAAMEMDMAVTALHRQGRATSRSAQGEGTHQFFRNYEEFLHRNDVEDDEVHTMLSLHTIYGEYFTAYENASDREDTDRYDPDTAAYYLRQIDSIETHFPLLFVQTGWFRPSHQYELGGPSLTDSVLEARYVESLRAKTPPDREAIAQAMAIAHKYSALVHELPVDTVLAQFKERLPSTAGLTAARDSLERISRAKVYRYDPMDWRALLYGVGLSCFALALLLSIFKNIYWQPFLIMVATMVLLPIVLLIFALLTEHGIIPADDGTILLWSYYLIALALIAQLFQVPHLRAYRTRTAVMTIMANMALPFFALGTVFILDNQLDVFGQRALQLVIDGIQSLNYQDPRLDALLLKREALRGTVTTILISALWGGVVLYIFVLHPLMRNLYTRLMALPERK